MEDMNAKGVILRAFDQFRLKSCIDFKPRDSEDYYISVKKLDGYVLFFIYLIFYGFRHYLCHLLLLSTTSHSAFGLLRLMICG